MKPWTIKTPAKTISQIWLCRRKTSVYEFHAHTPELANQNIVSSRYSFLIRIFFKYKYQTTTVSISVISYIMAVSVIGEGNQSTRRRPLTCRKSLTNFIPYCCIEYT